MPDRRYNFDGKKVLVMGLGRFGGGVDVARFAASSGAKVVVTDLASRRQLSDSITQLEEFPDIEYHLGSHDPADFKHADIIVANPAVAPDNEFLKLAGRHNKFITSQINIFFQLCPAPIIGITGTNGKSTTAALTAHLLKATRDEGRGTRDERGQKTEDRSQISRIENRASSIENVWLSGNIGNEPLLTRLNQIAPVHLVVLELSSFQIEQLAQIQKAPTVSLLTNLTPNHLDRYGTFADYCAAKENIFRFQVRRVGFSPPNKTWWGKPHPTENRPAVSIFNAEDRISMEWFDKYEKDADRICIKFSTDDISEDIRDSFSLPGRANLSNLAAALAVARHFGIDDGQLKTSLPQFRALPHRLELVTKINGVSWYNDSKATTPESAIAALEAFERPRIIIAGGYDKNVAFDELGERIAKNAKAAILFGQTAEKIADAIEKELATEVTEVTEDTERAIKIEIVDSLTQAVDLASRLAVSGDVVLLSPACASYDMFDNFEQRGREFTKLVQKMSGRLQRRHPRMHKRGPAL